MRRTATLVSSRGAVALEFAKGFEHLLASSRAPGDGAAEDLGADGVEPVLERGDDAEVAAAAAQRPEQVGVLVGRRAHDLALGGDHVHRDHVVAGPAVAARQVAEAAADGEAGDAGGGDEAEHGRQPVHLRLAVQIAQRAAGLRAADALRRIDPDAAQQRQVDHQPAVAHREAGDVVAAAAHRADERCSRANRTARTTSAVPVQRAISAGRRSIIAFQTWRASS